MHVPVWFFFKSRDFGIDMQQMRDILIHVLYSIRVEWYSTFYSHIWWLYKTCMYPYGSFAKYRTVLAETVCRWETFSYTYFTVLGWIDLACFAILKTVTLLRSGIFLQVQCQNFASLVHDCEVFIFFWIIGTLIFLF